jgi:hypothetical protein
MDGANSPRAASLGGLLAPVFELPKRVQAV